MKRGAVIGIAAGAAVVLVVGGGLVWWALTRPQGPEATARDFLTALADGDGERAASFIGGNVADGAAAALDGATALIEDPTVESVDTTEGGSTARAQVTFTLDGVERSASFGLVEGDRWLVDSDALGAVAPTTTLGDSVRIGGALVPAAGDVPLLPAVYDVVAAPRGLVTGSATAAVLPGSAETVAIEASLSPDATAAAQGQIDAYAAECTKPATAVPPNCGIRVPWAADLASLSGLAFRIDTAPVVGFSADARTFAATSGVLAATATGTTRDGATASFTYRADDWALRGTVAFTGDDMVLAVD